MFLSSLHLDYKILDPLPVFLSAFGNNQTSVETKASGKSNIRKQTVNTPEMIDENCTKKPNKKSLDLCKCRPLESNCR